MSKEEERALNSWKKATLVNGYMTKRWNTTLYVRETGVFCWLQRAQEGLVWDEGQNQCAGS